MSQANPDKEEDNDDIEEFIRGVKGGTKKEPEVAIVRPSTFQTTGDVLEAVERNERANEMGFDKALDSANLLLSFDKRFYQVKKKLLDYTDYKDLSTKLFASDRAPSAIAVVQNYLFVGNAAGVIRAFDVKTQKEMKSLKDDSLQDNKVTCLDVSEDGGFLISGYRGG